jgi:hypothetical protein
MRKGSNPTTPIRKTPSHCAVSIGKSLAGKSKGGNALKMQSVDKFNAMKGELLEKDKEERERLK